MMHGGESPVKFWYHHPAAAPDDGLQLLQTPDGKLHYRVIAGGKLALHGDAAEGTRIAAGAGLRLAVVKYLPHARPKIDFLPATAQADDVAAPESAVFVKVRAGGETKEVWLQRKEADQSITTPEGALNVGFDGGELDLGFSLKLVKFERLMNPGMMGDASFTSSVQLTDEGRKVDRPAEITMNQPLEYGVGGSASPTAAVPATDGRIRCSRQSPIRALP
jgi:hypothetical protein